MLYFTRKLWVRENLTNAYNNFLFPVILFRLSDNKKVQHYFCEQPQLNSILSFITNRLCIPVHYTICKQNYINITTGCSDTFTAVSLTVIKHIMTLLDLYTIFTCEAEAVPAV